MMPFLLMKRAGIALGSNMGDKNSLMVQARDHLLKMSLSDDPFLQSSLYATSPQGCPHGADDYLNAVVEFTWPGTVEELLVHCQGIERALGRIRSGIRCEPRTADVDIIYAGGHGGQRSAPPDSPPSQSSFEKICLEASFRHQAGPHSAPPG